MGSWPPSKVRGRGIRSAIAFRDEMRQLGVEIRAGLHTGEVELRGDDVGGMAVHIAAPGQRSTGRWPVKCRAIFRTGI